ncbi:hypothetical protein OC717_02300 [Candidatus Phytoplasma australasiaticum]|uniref:hypothetical protein n=1 Tax=Candidatus Phytoplasma australasiaticum TaxID=2754999 RepID=UPI002713ABBE|nr:hypothetical protein [Candidatus Phytoplasma australasiaticum]MDO8058955.1 hypothetical protein [Candidatus Phytoplasma australasiaticum]
MINFFINVLVENITPILISLVLVFFCGFKIHPLKNKNIPDNINLTNKKCYLQNKTIIMGGVIIVFVAVIFFLCNK